MCIEKTPTLPPKYILRTGGLYVWRDQMKKLICGKNEERQKKSSGNIKYVIWNILQM